MKPPKLPKITMPKFPVQMQMPRLDVSTALNPDNFENLIKQGNGTKMKIAKSMLCPYVRDVNGADHSPNCKCRNGYIYFDEQDFTGVLTNNTTQRSYQPQGTWDIDDASIVIPVYDNSNREIIPSFMDQIIVFDEPVRFTQRMEHSQTGVDRLHFPALSVEMCMDSADKRYIQNQDFVINGTGMIEWLSAPGASRPKYDPTIDTGQIYSITYSIRPVFTVIGVQHNIRNRPAPGPNGEMVQIHYPTTVMCRRNFLPHNTNTTSIGQDTRVPPRDGNY